MRPLKTPAYRFHKARQCAVVTINGKDHYLGIYQSPESLEHYHRLIAEHLSAKRHSDVNIDPKSPLTVTELIAAYWKHAKSYYVKNGEMTGEVGSIKFALRFVRRLYGTTPAEEFSPKKLKAVREAMIALEMTRLVNVTDPETGVVHKEKKVIRKGLARKCINKLIARVRRMYAWAVEEELVSVTVHDALQRVSGLRKGKSAAREKGRVLPVSEEHVAKVLPHVPEIIADMIRVQRLIGSRPQEVVQIRFKNIDTSKPIWEYRPERFKTEHHHEDHISSNDRVIFIGPQCQAILNKYTSLNPEEYLFSPVRSELQRNQARRLARTSQMTPSQRNRVPKGRTKGEIGNHYSVSSYRRAINRACVKAGIPQWSPNQLRHLRLTEIRKHYGLEASRVCGGHREIGVTQMYAEQDQGLAREVMSKIG